MRKPVKTASKGISVNFSDTETTATLPEGDYLFRIDDVVQKTSDNSGADYLSITAVVDEGAFKGKKVWHNCSLQPQALFNLRGVLEALGFEVPQGVMELDPADMIGECFGGTVQLEVYEGKKKARLVEFFPVDELTTDEEAKSTSKTVKKASDKPAPKEEPAEEEEEEKPAPKKKTKKAAAPAVIKVGSTVTFVDDEGDVITGRVIALEDEDATVLVGKEEWEISLDELTAA